jgi:DNA (cytosine-5)-methyltransferase 1
VPTSTAWTASDIAAWRHRLHWTQQRAAEALGYHLHAFKKLEYGDRPIADRVRRFALLLEREHIRSLNSSSGAPGSRQVYATADRAVARMEALQGDGKLVDRRGRARLRYLSLFSGLEGCTAALESIGPDSVAVGYADIDPASNAVCRYRWPDVPRLGNITEVDWSLLRGHVDMIAGGSPCQSFSVSGKRLGISDPRGNLALHFLRVAAAIQPQWILYENVPGLLSSGGGNDFETLLDEMEGLGYSVAWRILDARDFGLPQRRKRLFLVAERSGSADGPASILALRTGQGGRVDKGRAGRKVGARRVAGSSDELTPEPDVDWSEAAAWLSERVPAPVADAKSPEVDTAATYMAADLRHCTVGQETMTIQVGPATGWSLNAMPCLVTTTAEGSSIRRFSPRECLALQGFDHGWCDGVKLSGKPLADSVIYGLAGNAWAVPVVSWIMGRLLEQVAADRMREAA